MSELSSSNAGIEKARACDRGRKATLRREAANPREDRAKELNPALVARPGVFLGWLLAKEGKPQGIELIREAMAKLESSRGGLQRSMHGAMLAEACASMGRTGEALTVFDETLPFVRTGEHYYEAELQRLRGELLLMRSAGEAANAEDCFRAAIDIARRQSAKSWELHATMSLARLRAKQGKRDEARAMLADIYAWFTEGFDTADLKDAKALLDELSA